MSFEAADHLLYILSLIALYPFNALNKLLVLITAFTVGHSLTLILSIVNFIHFNSDWVEFLIPITILITALFNIYQQQSHRSNKWIMPNYFLALAFGVIHGMGFANGIRFMLADTQAITLPLFSFNAGLEVAQIVVVFIMLLSIFAIERIFKIRNALVTYTVSGISGFSAIIMCFERWPL
jgi:hypothetical protein